uniref:sugar ABC transporter ATP-binding protein n=1 Tax=unclassified Candidatus Frackibacter TaxID=2648818 RepID=UPI002A4E165F|nr:MULTISPECIES: sugar ABC transporter ATP-binding protein [unclassified Candidatus Frackibacter]
MVKLSEVILEMKDIIKDFPGVRALDHVNFQARTGEVLALVGENGAGKSTLMKVLSGVWPYPTYEGELYIKGDLKEFTNTREAEEAGVAIIHQELNLIPGLSVTENIFLDKQETNFCGKIEWFKLHSKTKELLEKLNITDIQPTDLIKELTVGQQQMIEIAKALSVNAEILVFDEPTSALTDREIEDLFMIIRALKAQGVCMIYISHKMEEIEEIADRVTVLRDGKTIGETTRIKDITLDEIITRMVGRDIEDMFPKQDFEQGEKTLEVKGINVEHPFLTDEKKVEDVSFSAYKGQILGIAGLMGSGRTELVSGIFGVNPDETTGEVYLNGKELSINSPQDAIQEGIGLVTEDRKLLGLLLGQDIVTNTTLASLDYVSKYGVINKLEERKVTNKYVDELNIKTPNIDVNVNTLSGGNQQKVVIGKWLATKPEVLILDEPTRGIDVGAKVEVYRLMNKLVEEGVTVIMISSELPEIMGMSDRVLVMCEGKLVADLDREEATKEKVMEYATGNFKGGSKA